MQIDLQLGRRREELASHFPIKLLTVAVILTLLTFVWFGWVIFDARRDASMVKYQSSRIEELRGVILHLDQVLTMSARMAAATGEPAWEERYRRLEPQLDAAIKETIKFGASLAGLKAATKTDEANTKLVEMENRAFSLVRAGRTEEARAILSSPDYETQKQVYAEGMASFIGQIHWEFDKILRADQTFDLVSMMAAVSVGGISFVSWLLVMRGLRQWRAQLLESLRRRTAAEENVLRAHAELERRIQERTSDLAKTNEVLQDEIAARKRTEELLRVQATALDTAANAILITDPHGTIQSANHAFTTLTGYSAQEVVGKNPRILKGGKHDAAFYQTLWQTISSGKVWSGELTNRRKDGSLYVEEMTITPLRNVDGAIARYIAIKQDVTERKRAEELLRQSKERLHHVISANPAVIYSLKFANGELVPTWISDNIIQLTGHKAEEIYAPNWWAERLHADDRERVVAEHAAPFPDDHLLTEYRFQRKDGSYIWVRDEKTLLRDAAGRPVEVVGSWADITGRKRSEVALSQSEERFRQLAANVTDVFYMTSPDMQQMHYVSPAYEQIWGHSTESLYANPHQWAEAILPEERERVFATFSRLAADESSANAEFRIARPDGTVRWIFSRGFQVRDTAGKVIRITGIASDITERKRLEDQLIQSQKLETVGKLAGGIAHEFNSIMTAIIGQSELLLSDLPSASPLSKNAQEIRKAADRAATLTRQLLAYGRKQILQPEILDLNTVLEDMENMLPHLMGGDVDVRIVFTIGLKLVKADAGQIEQVILNMAINARDAMPNGGKLTLEASNVTLNQDSVGRHVELKPGDYVMLAITDTGTGMSEQVKKRLFEPFFTTKGVGQGTGLGLATCYGIVKQSGGHINVYSESGKGTTFKVYLPQLEHQKAVLSEPRAPSDLPRGTETILLVEDDPALREMAGMLLQRLGYSVLAAANGMNALTLVEQRGKQSIDLLFTDVVMPQMDGKELSERIRALHPETRLLFTSAYTENAIVHQGVLDPGVALLQKPFTPSALAHKVRKILDQSHAAAVP